MAYQITPNMHQILSNEFIADEIKVVLFQMRPTKAPRPDGMNALLYQYCVNSQSEESKENV